MRDLLLKVNRSKESNLIFSCIRLAVLFALPPSIQFELEENVSYFRRIYRLREIRVETLRDFADGRLVDRNSLRCQNHSIILVKADREAQTVVAESV